MSTSRSWRFRFWCATEGWRARSTCARRGRARSWRKKSSCCSRSPRRSRSPSSTRSSTREAQRRVDELEALARISEAVSDSLYLEESLAAIVKTTMDALDATGAALVLEDGNIAWPEGRPGAYAERLAAALARSSDRRARLRPRVHRRRPAAAHVDRAPRRRCAGARARGDARRARARDPPPREEQPPDGASCCGCRRARPRDRPARGARAIRSTGSSRSRPCTRC